MPALQIRNLPDDVHRTLKARAAMHGQSLSEYASHVLRAAAETPTVEELSARIRARGTAGKATTAEVAALIRRDRARP
jgi:plasmid stability protein